MSQRYATPSPRGEAHQAPPRPLRLTRPTVGYLLRIIGSGMPALKISSPTVQCSSTFSPALLHRAAPKWPRSRPGSNGCRSPSYACMTAITYIEAQRPARPNAAARGVLQCSRKVGAECPSSALGHGVLGGTSRSTSPDPGRLRARRTTTQLLAKERPGPRAQQMDSVSQVERALRRNTTSPICTGTSGGLDGGGGVAAKARVSEWMANKVGLSHPPYRSP